MPAGATAIAGATSVLGLPANAGENPNALVGRIACSSASSCVVVGTFADASFSLRGFSSSGGLSGWSRGVEVHAPANAYSDPGVSLNGLSCPSASDCVAVGSYTDGAIGGSPMVATWNRGAWSRGVEVGLPKDENSSRSSALSGISCSSSTTCTAVGNYINSYDVLLPISATEINGRWSAARMISPPLDIGGSPGLAFYAGQEGYALVNDLSCEANGTCVAVGEYSTLSRGQVGLIATERHGRWTTLAAPIPRGAASDPNELLNAVSCRGTTCVAVGSFNAKRNGMEPLVEVASNGRWSTPIILGLPRDARANKLAELEGVACTASLWCEAVGDYTNSSGRYPLVASGIVARWGAGSRGPVPSDAASDPVASMTAVTCAERGNCIAAGSYENAKDAQQAFVLSL